MRNAEHRQEMRQCIGYFAGQLGLSYPAATWLYGSWGQWNRWYSVFGIPKKREGFRTICAPQPLLKKVQRRLIDVFLQPVPLHAACHGFRPGHSIETNAQRHIGKEVVLNLDLRDFFPSITARRVYGMWQDLLGLEPEKLRFLTRLTTLNDTLPQGAPTSPYIANIICRHLDQRLSGLAASLGADYSRYADDLTFSGPRQVNKALPLIRQIIQEEGFAVADEKVRVYDQWDRQAVNGLTVNSRVAVARKNRRRFRALLHNWRLGKAVHWQGKPVTKQFIIGYLAYLQMIQPEERKLIGQVGRRARRPTAPRAVAPAMAAD